METPTDKEIENRLVAIISDGFNRALSALAQSNAIDTRKLDYNPQSKSYKLVTEQIVLTAKYAAPTIRQLFSGGSDSKIQS